MRRRRDTVRGPAWASRRNSVSAPAPYATAAREASASSRAIGVAASIRARDVTNAAKADYAYGLAVRAFVRELKREIAGKRRGRERALQSPASSRNGHDPPSSSHFSGPSSGYSVGQATRHRDGEQSGSLPAKQPLTSVEYLTPTSSPVDRS